MDLRNRNIYNKRVFGKDLTNINQRSKNFSISEKPSQHLPIQPFKIKSRSFSYKTFNQYKDPITHYQSQIMNFMTSIQKMQKYQIFKHINEDMRFILVEWLIQVHESFQLKQQTLYLAFTYLNQFSSKVQITKQEYQLAGITCLWIASKYQQIYPPKMKNYVQVTDNSYSSYELKQMEGKIIQALNFNLTYTTTLSVLQVIADKWPKQRNFKKQYTLTKDAQKNYSMCKYLLQLSNICNLAKRFDTNTLVFAAITLSDSIFKTKSDIKCIQQESKPDKQVLLNCFRQMCNNLQEASKSTKFKALMKKFSQQKYQRVAKIKIAQK